MSNKAMTSNRGFGGGCGCGGGLGGFFDGFDLEDWILPILVIFLLFSAGGGILDFLFCEDTIIWIVLLLLLLGVIHD